jgi:2'-5' RNA ligase
VGLVRVFVALAIPEDVRVALGRVQDRLRPAGADVAWVRPPAIHATLRFIGDTNEERVPAITGALAVAAEGIAPFAVEAKGTGFFPHEKRPRVVWIGLTGDLPALLRLQARVEKAVVAVGYPEETRPFAPHLTLGRVKSVRRVDALVRAAEGVTESRGAFAVDRVILYRSELRPQGAIYSRLAEAPLIG